MSIYQIDWQEVARLMLLSRELDLVEEELLVPQGKIKNQVSAKGHELSQVLLAQTLDHPHDAAADYYRSRPFLLASGLSPATALAAGFGAEISASIAAEAFTDLDAPIQRLATPEIPMPMMVATLPSVEMIRGKIDESLSF